MANKEIRVGHEQRYGADAKARREAENIDVHILDERATIMPTGDTKRSRQPAPKLDEPATIMAIGDTKRSREPTTNRKMSIN